MAFQKGHPNVGGRPKGAKNRATLIQEERRAIFNEQISQKWEKVIDALRPEYIADQFLGKAPDKIEHSGTIDSKTNLSVELIEAAKKELKKNKTSE